MSKKTLDVSSMQNELSSSAFFRSGSVQPPAPISITPDEGAEARVAAADDSDEVPPPPSPAAEGSVQVDSASSQQVQNSRPVDVTTDAPTDASPDRSTGRVQRITMRRSFELYQDQLETLQEFRAKEIMSGGKGSMSSMVRVALDAYIGKRRRLKL